MRGDDYLSSGWGEDLDWLDQGLQKKYSIKTQRLCEKVGEREANIRNRIARITHNGYDMEAYPQHAELIIEQMLGENHETGKPIMLPGADGDDKSNDNNEDVRLEGQDATVLRNIAVRCLYLFLDRPELQFSAQEVRRVMSSPTTSSCKKLQRVAESICSYPRLAWSYKWQPGQTTISIYGDSNWVSCATIHKYTSGGAVLLCGHCLKTWSRIHCLVAKSRAEAELYACDRAACEGLGFQTPMRDLEEEVAARVFIDASAATHHREGGVSKSAPH